MVLNLPQVDSGASPFKNLGMLGLSLPGGPRSHGPPKPVGSRNGNTLSREGGMRKDAAGRVLFLGPVPSQKKAQEGLWQPEHTRMAKQRGSGALTQMMMVCEVGRQKDAVPGVLERRGFCNWFLGPRQKDEGGACLIWGHPSTPPWRNNVAWGHAHI